MSAGIIVDKPQALPEALARRFEEVARASIAARGRFAVALPGGSVAVSCFPRLAACPVDWSRTEFFFGDERGVPPSDPESNYGQARSLWLDRVAADTRRVHRMQGEREDLEAAAAEHERELLGVLGDPPRLDLVILGAGPDGHVCSLFPGHPALRERSRWVVALPDSPKPPPRRLTLTLPALLQALEVVVMATGAAKASVVRAALEDAASDLPLALVARGAAKTLFLLDEEAAGLVERGETR
jgi:6-phosphogluconolactonase